MWRWWWCRGRALTDGVFRVQADVGDATHAHDEMCTQHSEWLAAAERRCGPAANVRSASRFACACVACGFWYRCAAGPQPVGRSRPARWPAPSPSHRAAAVSACSRSVSCSTDAALQAGCGLELRHLLVLEAAAAREAEMARHENEVSEQRVPA